MIPIRKPELARWKAIANEARRYREKTMAQVSPPAPKVPSETPKNVVSLCDALFAKSKAGHITSLPPEEILKQLLTRESSSVEVTTAFLQRAAVAQRLVNCLTELLPERALKRAKELDEYMEKYGHPIGPLHGLPISVNEELEMEGLKVNWGYIYLWDGDAETTNAPILQMLHSAGAVFHCRTTVSQTMMHLETDSNLYGTTVNPWNSSLTSGGSCGGEGALIALRGSPLGVGTDFGGSMRIPAAYCGTFGFRPTVARFPHHECETEDPNEFCAIGAISTSVPALKLIMRTIIETMPWIDKPQLKSIKWRESTRLPRDSKLRIGVLWHDGVITPHPPVTNALCALVKKLRQGRNIELVDFEPYDHERAWKLTAPIYFNNKKAEFEDIITILGREPMRPLTKHILQDFSEYTTRKLDTCEHARLHEGIQQYRKEYAAHWEKYNIDVLLCPATPGVAPKHNTSKYWGYTNVWSCLDYPALVFPAGLALKDVDILAESPPVLNTAENRAHMSSWDPQEMDGMPVSLQLVGKSCEDEKLLHVYEAFFKELCSGLTK